MYSASARQFRQGHMTWCTLTRAGVFAECSFVQRGTHTAQQQNRAARMVINPPHATCHWSMHRGVLCCIRVVSLAAAGLRRIGAACMAHMDTGALWGNMRTGASHSLLWRTRSAKVWTSCNAHKPGSDLDCRSPAGDSKAHGAERSATAADDAITSGKRRGADAPSRSRPDATPCHERRYRYAPRAT
jgi:hypothetical protein